jgi:serine acetyltransferase
MRTPPGLTKRRSLPLLNIAITDTSLTGMDGTFGTKKSMGRGIVNRILHLMARLGPGCTTIRPFLHKLRGVKINGHVFIGDEVYLENDYPECVEINDGAQIALRSTIIAHFRGSGKIIIGKNVWIGPHSLVAASRPGQVVTIGEGAVLAGGSVVTKDVPPGTFVGGVPARHIAFARVPMSLETSYEDFQKGLVR